jgi:hypothetical protein
MSGMDTLPEGFDAEPFHRLDEAFVRPFAAATTVESVAAFGLSGVDSVTR